jgi:hypothetical protein
VLHTQVFRTFLISDAVLTTTSILAGVLSATDSTGGEPSESLLHVLVEIAVLVVWIVALAGLWRFQNWARFVYLAVAGVGLLGTLLVGGESRSGFEASINALCWLVTGVIIALAYWSPLADTFRADERAA